MKSFILPLLIAALVQTLSAAETSPERNVTKAAKELGAQPNYSWTTSTKEADGSSGRLGPIEGKTQRDGLVYLSFSLGGGGIPVEVFVQGDKGTAKALEGWQTFDEISQTSGTAAAIVRLLRSYKTPALQAADLAGKLEQLKAANGVFSGELKPEAAKELLLQGTRRREGQAPPQITDPKGSVKFWLKEGALTKYELNVQGKITAGERETEVNRTTTVEIKDVGATKLELPPEAKQKLT
jgi:hypothetical protein